MREEFLQEDFPTGPSAEVVEEDCFEYQYFPGVWRDGNKLVMSKRAELPPYCVRSGAPAEVSILRGFVWCWLEVCCFLLPFVFPPAVALAFLIPKVPVYVPLTSSAKFYRELKITLAATMLFLGVIANLAALTAREEFALALSLFLGGQFLFIGGIVLLLRSIRILEATRVTPDFMWLKGVHPSLLDRLATWDSA